MKSFKIYLSLSLLGGILIAGGCGNEGVPFLPSSGSPPGFEGDGGFMDGGLKGAVIYVPADYSSIQDAIDAASAGDVVVVSAGTYTENIRMRSGVSVVGEGYDTTVLNGSVTFSLVDDSSITGFTISSDAYDDYGIYCDGGDCEVTSCLITGWMFGMYEENSSGGNLIDSNIFTMNLAGLVISYSDAIITNNIASYNSYAGIVALDYSGSTVVNNTLIGNAFAGTADYMNAGYCADETSSSTFRNNIVVSNYFGINCTGCFGAFSHNDVWGNFTNYINDASASSTDISLDPLFVDFSEDDFRLTSSSPCIDSGTFSSAPDHDFDGNTRPDGERNDIGAFEYVTSSYTLVLSEVMANPSDESTGEFVELYNYGGSPVDAAGLIISDSDATDTLTAYDGGTSLIPSLSYAVILDPDYAGEYSIPSGTTLLTVADSAIGNSWGIALSDPVTLYDGTTIIDTYAYPKRTSDGVSVEKRDLFARDSSDNWGASPCDASPGEENCITSPTSADISGIIVTEVMTNPSSENTGEYVEIYNTGSETVDVSTLILSDSAATDELVPYSDSTTLLEPNRFALILDRNYEGQYIIPGSVPLLTTSDNTIGNGLSISDHIYIYRSDGTTLIDSYTYPVAADDGYSVEKVDFTAGDSDGNWAVSTCPIGHSAGRLNCNSGGSGDNLVINEVMANPLDEDTGEFVEIFNLGPGDIDIAGLMIYDGADYDTIQAFDGGTTSIPSEGYGVILDQEYADDYDIPSSAILLTLNDTNIGNGLTTSDSLFLLETDGMHIVDSYTFPSNPGNGISIEKVNPYLGDSGTNWEASSCPEDSSPGALNCASYEPIPSGTSTLILTEIMANPLVEDTGEFIEIYNYGDSSVDVYGLVIYDGDSIDLLRGFEGGSTLIPPDGYGVVLDSEYADDYYIPFDAVLLTTSDDTIASGIAISDPIYIYEADGYSLIDSYSNPFNPGNGYSAEKVNYSVWDVPSNWTASPCGSTPGEDNCASP